MVKMHIRGDKLLVKVTNSLLQKGWYGGQWVKYVGKRIVDLADASSYSGFILLGHKLIDTDGNPYDFKDGVIDAIPFQYENKAVDASGQTLIIAGGGDFDFNKNAYDTTQTYSYNQRLYVNNKRNYGLYDSNCIKKT